MSDNKAKEDWVNGIKDLAEHPLKYYAYELGLSEAEFSKKINKPDGFSERQRNILEYLSGKSFIHAKGWNNDPRARWFFETKNELHKFDEHVKQEIINQNKILETLEGLIKRIDKIASEGVINRNKKLDKIINLLESSSK